MNITREDMPGRQVALTIELEPEVVNTALDRAYRQMVNQVNVPGFRRGKAPRYIIERYMGKEALAERAVKNILPQTLQDAIAEQKIDAMDVSDFEIVSMDPLQVKVIIIQQPKIELGDYSAIRVEKETTEITPEQVDEVITELRRESAPWNEPGEPRPIKEGDMVYLDLEGFTTEGEMDEVKREGFPTIVGLVRAGVPEVVNKALEGMSVGDEKDITDTLPEDYPKESLRGKDASYHLKVVSMKEQQLPGEAHSSVSLDEFAKTLNFDTVDVMRETVERNLRQRYEESAETAQVDKIIDQLVASSTVEVPDVLVNEELDSLLKSLENRLKEQRINLRQYFTFGGMNEKEWREANRERARERVIRSLALHEFAHREGISVDEEEVEGEINTMLDRFDEEEKEKARAAFSGEEMRHTLEDRVYQRKLIDHLIGIAEGRIEAAPPPAKEEGEAAPDGAEATSSLNEPLALESAFSPERSEWGSEGEAKDQSDVSVLENAGGAAEVLGTEGVDLKSPNETGEAPGGGTPSSAPALETPEAQA